MGETKLFKHRIDRITVAFRDSLVDFFRSDQQLILSRNTRGHFKAEFERVGNDYIVTFRLLIEKKGGNLGSKENTGNQIGG